MRTSRISDFELIHEQVPLDDGTLVKMFHKLHDDVVEKKEELDSNLMNNNENDYLSIAVAKLAYGFTKEKHDTLFEEAKKRGLIAE